MKTLEKGSDKIKEICDLLKAETLEPAKKEAEKMLAAVKAEGEQILAEARAKAEEMVQTAKLQIEKEKEVFKSSLSQACKQGLEQLKQDIANKLFNQEVDAWLKEGFSNPRLVAELVNAIVEALAKEGTSADLMAYIPSKVSAQEVYAMLADKTKQLLKAGDITVGKFGGGAQLKLRHDKLTIDISNEAVKELIAGYLRKDFRALIFQN